MSELIGPINKFWWETHFKTRKFDRCLIVNLGVIGIAFYRGSPHWDYFPETKRVFGWVLFRIPWKIEEGGTVPMLIDRRKYVDSSSQQNVGLA